MSKSESDKERLRKEAEAIAKGELFTITAKAKVALSPDGEEPNKSQLLYSKLGLELSGNLNHDSYYTDGAPNATGIKAMTIALAHGLVANIKMAEQKGHWERSEHLDFLMQEIGRGLVTETENTEGQWDE